MAARLLLLLFVSACAAELGFQPKQQYAYEYEAKQASGIPGLLTQWSALGLKMKILIQVPTPGNLYFQLTDMHQGELKNEHTHQEWRSNMDIPYQTIQEHRDTLGKVFKVVMNGGVVSSMVVSSDEPIWVVNIKKAIVQLFQLDLNAHHAVLSPGMAQPRGYQSGEPADNFFRVMEDSIGGECETLYEMTESLPDTMKQDLLQEIRIHAQSSTPQLNVPESSHFNPFVVTKTKNYQNCKSRPIWQHMTPGAVSCRSDDCYLTASNRSATARYVLDGDRSAFRMQAVVAESEALVFPYGHETEQLWTVTNQTLLLLSQTQMASFIGEPQHQKTFKHLSFQYPTVDGEPLGKPELTSEPQISSFMPGAPAKLIRKELSVQQLVARVVAIIKQVDGYLQQVPDPGQQDVTGYIVEIEHAFSWMGYNQLQQVYQQLHSQGQKEIYWDTLAMTGTNPAVMKVLDGVEKNEISVVRSASIISTLPITIKTPTFELMQRIVNLFKSQSIQDKKPLRTTMALALGNVFYQLCVSNTTVEHSYTQQLYKQRFCSREMKGLLKTTFIPYLEQLVQRTPKPEKLVYIQALGNTGSEHIIWILGNLLHEQKDHEVASRAIYAFYRVVSQYPEKVRKVVAPVFHNVSLPTEVRLAAVTMLLTTNPPIAYWQKIATSTWFEPSDTVVAFIHSTYNTMANITMAHVKPLFEMSRRARITLPLIRPPTGGYAFSGSFDYHSGQIIPEYQVAALSRMSLIASNSSVIPSVVYLEFQHYINSIVYSKQRMTLNVQGGQKILDQLMGVSSFDSSRRSPRDLNVGSEIMSSLLSQIRPIKPSENKFQATLYAQLMGAMDAFFMVDETLYSEMLPTTRQASLKRVQVQKIVYLVDTTATFASEIGMPVIYSKKMPVVMSVRGDMNVQWNVQQGTYEANLQNIQPFVAFKNIVVVSTVNPFSLRQLGTGVANSAQLSLPMSLKAKLDVSSKKLQVEVETIQHPSPVQVIHIRTTPFTTAVKVNEYQSIMKSADTKEIKISQHKMIKLPFGNIFGVNGMITLSSDSSVMNFGTFWSELRKRGSTGVTNFWFMMSSLRGRHYDVVIDTAHSSFRKFQATFTGVSSSSSEQAMRQPIISNAEHNRQVSTIITSAKKLIQDTKQMSQGQQLSQKSLPVNKEFGFAAVATITKNDNSMLHYKSQFAWVSDAQWYNQKLFFKGETSAQKVCLQAKLAIPQLSDKRQTLLNSEISAPLWAKLGYGSECGQHALTMDGSISRDQDAKAYATSCPEAQRCSLHEQHGNPNSADCRIAKNHAAIANLIKLDFTAQNLTPYFRNQSYGIDFVVKHMLWPYMSNNPYATSTPNKISVKVQMKPATNAMNAYIVKPFETTIFEDVPLSFNMLYEPGLLTMRKSMSKKLADIFYGVDQTVCIVDQNMIKTFDNVTMQRPQPRDGQMVLAVDASATRDLLIMEKRQQGQPGASIHVSGKLIEISAQNLAAVKTSAGSKTLTVEQPVIVLSGDSRVLAEVLMLAPDTVKVVLPQHFVKLLVTKEGVQIRASQLAYRNRMRGACGNLDGERQGEQRGPTGALYTRGQDFCDAWSLAQTSPLQFRTPSGAQNQQQQQQRSTAHSRY